MAIIRIQMMITLLNQIQNPIPHYLVGALPVIITLGTTPHSGIKAKLQRLFLCLGCPFIGLLYFCNVSNNKTEMCTYWLKAECFYEDHKKKIQNDQEMLQNDFYEQQNDLEKQGGQGEYTSLARPMGFHTKIICPNAKQESILDLCVEEASLIDRFSSLISAFYIIFGIAGGITILFENPCSYDSSYQDWPFITTLFIWTLPVITFRSYYGRVVFRIPKREINMNLMSNSLENNHINEISETSVKVLNTENPNVPLSLISNENPIKVKPLDYSILYKKRRNVIITLLISTTLHWISVIIAYLTPPVAFLCRSRYLSIICTIWTVNSLIAAILHIKNTRINLKIWFRFCGIIIGILLIVFGLLTTYKSWWYAISPLCRGTCE
ncbi:11807_t:CDS:1 [Dentiscutata erythropus]|uniref:11807_t:CDS:1 n=1 Tax=Dentiscutata erythropus TaxID=1348616 RepID=A0A9N9BVW0_9GLOM|nr:11807_t:CDS:1 [Dentiscutata erythropus]